METKDLNTPEEQDKRPDFLIPPVEAEDFGGHANEPDAKKDHPELGNQSQTGAATNSSELEIEPEPRDTGGVVGPND